MREFFDLATLVDAILAITLIEGIVLLVYAMRTGRGIGAADLLPNLLAGLCLIMALRLATSGAAWYAVGPCMLAALVCHLVDLRRRWRF
jgi:hypothetical protein